MDNLRKTNITVFLLALCCLLSCKNNKRESMQPYESYTLATNKQEINQILKDKCVDTISFAAGDKIADIGAANGSVDIMLSVFHDSLTFYIQDIDTSVCNQKAINELVIYYQGIKGKQFKNKFIIVAGDDDETNLPDNTFDKVLILWTYQYFKNPRAIMTDLTLKLKNDGLLYIVNPDIDPEGGKKLTEDFGWNASPVEKEISDIIDCGYELIRVSRNYESPEWPYILVFKKKIR